MILLAALLLAGSPPHAQPFPVRVGECRWVHGEFKFWLGSGIRRIWVIGTKHMLNLHDWDEDVPDHRFSMKNAWPNEVYHGDFYVCAVRRFIPGHMQRVSLKAVRRLVVKKISAN
jgi:hypothetical protein